MKKRYKLTSVLIAAIVAALLLAGAAVAAMQSDLLRNLFPGGAPPEAEGLLIQDALSTEQEGVKLTIGEHLYDGRNFHLNWTVESTRDDTVYYLLNYTMHYPDGTPVEISRWSNRSSSSDQGRNTLTGLNLTLDGKTSAKSYLGATSNGFLIGEAPTEPWIYTVDVEVYTSALTPVAIETAESIPEDQAKQLSKNRQLAIEMEQFGYIHEYPEYLAVYDPMFYGHSSHPNMVKARVDAHNKCGLLKPLAHLSVSINLDPSKAQGMKAARLVEPTTLQFRDTSIAFESLLIDLTGSDMAYDVPVNEEKGDWFYLCNEFVVVDPDGTSVAWELSSGSMSYGDGTMPDGSPSLRLEGGGMPMPISKLPSELRFIRIPAAIRIPNHTPLAEEVLAYLAEHPEDLDEATLTLTIE